MIYAVKGNFVKRNMFTFQNNINFLCRVKAFEDKLNGYNKEVEAFRKKEVISNSPPQARHWTS